MNLLITIFILTIAILIPDHAMAWGPGVHLALGNSVLGSMNSLPPLMAALLFRHQNAFLYGCLSADIFIGKGSSFRLGHSHNWVTGFKLLNSAKDPRLLSYAYGYLTHLAADVVAHNYFVPNTLWTMPSGGKLSHVYVEAQADQKFETERESALALFRRPNRDTDGSLLSTMHRKRLPFLLKKQIIKGSLKLTGRKGWGESLRLADRLLPWPQDTRHLDEMFTLSENIIFDFLNDPKSSPSVSFDPIGSGNLREVRKMRMGKTRHKQQTLLFNPHESLVKLPRPDAYSRALPEAKVGS
ncbi:MAG: zinc dependent phospholipase C family protein [Pseudodesulfovibrio sp.]|nr:zinc dependent phospholipase C family protein [Pseudodesulfovibrio sp.]